MMATIDTHSFEGEATWNVFRRNDEAGLWCAVPSDRAVPRFLLSGKWTYGGSPCAGAARSAFNRRAARHGADLNGYYLFQPVCIEAPREAPRG